MITTKSCLRRYSHMPTYAYTQPLFRKKADRRPPLACNPEAQSHSQRATHLPLEQYNAAGKMTTSPLLRRMWKSKVCCRHAPMWSIHSLSHCTHRHCLEGQAVSKEIWHPGTAITKELSLPSSVPRKNLYNGMHATTLFSAPLSKPQLSDATAANWMARSSRVLRKHLGLFSRSFSQK